MNEPPQLLRPTRHSSGQSPTRQKHQRLSDDILAHVTPATAVDSLASATGALRACLDGASAAERDFAFRAALASRRVWEWVDELGEWSWPSEGGAAGFEATGGKRRKLSIQVTAPEGEAEEYIGSLPAADVAKYESRAEEIRRELDKLAVEEIKSHVLTNHIMPLSRPGTPMSDSQRSFMSSSGTYNKMEDLTAVVTAIAVQMLPNLAKLARLLHTWSMRLSVLQSTRPLLKAVEDAEVALRSGWSAISLRPKGSDQQSGEDAAPQTPTLTRDDFNLMKTVLQKKVSKPARTLDYMLDCLEGMPDTLPEKWLDRMDAVERDYGEWVAACERRIRETDWARAIRLREQSRSTSPEKESHGENGFAKPCNRLSIVDPADTAVALPVPLESGDVEEPSKKRRDRALVQEHQMEHQDEPSETGGENDDPQPESRAPTTGVDGARDPEEQSSSLVAIDRSTTVRKSDRSGMDPADEICSPDEVTGSPGEEDEPELPPMKDSSRRASNASQTSTVMHGASSHFEGSSDLPEVSASPGVSRSKIREAEYVEASPPSSPPVAPSDVRDESSVAAPDSPSLPPLAPTIPEEGDSALLPRPTGESSYMDDFDDSISVSEIISPVDRRDSVGDQHLRQQITQIIESIPAKIKLSAEPPTVNLNPPDLQLPRLRKKPSKEPVRRSTSAMSTMSTVSSRAASRAATPSFTLSPAKNARARNQRGQQEIKVYHLSRSTGEAPIKLFIRCVGEHGERVMVRVGGGWADLSEYLKEYASHHGRRSGNTDKPAKVEVRDLPRVSSGRGPNPGSSPPSRPASALDSSPITTPLNVRKTRRSVGAASSEAPRSEAPRLQPRPKTPAGPSRLADETPPSDAGSTRSRSSSHLSWVEDDSSFLGLAGPSGKKVDMSEENKAWVESVKEKVRLASGEHKVVAPEERNRLGEMGRVGGTKRLFRKSEDRRDAKR